MARKANIRLNEVELALLRELDEHKFTMQAALMDKVRQSVGRQPFSAMEHLSRIGAVATDPGDGSREHPASKFKWRRTERGTHLLNSAGKGTVETPRQETAREPRPVLGKAALKRKRSGATK
jgi:hypothetical protein